jgi:MoxR-like ATPase
MTQLKDKSKIEDADYLKAMYSGTYGTGVRRLFELLGGSPTQIPRSIADVRAKFSTMLFLDEYFRKTSTSIRNMLRGVLNRRLGFDRLPDSVYVLFASNINDDGVEAIPHNNQFSVMDVNRPDKDAWFSYVTDRAEDLGIKLSDDVVNLFYKNVAAQEMPELDENGNKLRRPLIWSQDSTDPTGVRISPRRLEQMLHYVNASLPVKNMKAARALLTNMKQNFIKDDGDTDFTPVESETGDSFMADLVDLIKASNPELQGEYIQELPYYRWRDALHHQIMRKLKLGDVRTYIPVISGPFGIGKTTAMDSIATSLKLGQIYIDCSTLSAEDVTGTPLPTRDAEGNESVEFADSKLYKIINQQAAEVEPEEATKTVEQDFNKDTVEEEIPIEEEEMLLEKKL